MSLEAIRVGGFDMDGAIQNFLRREYGMAIGERTAEEVKIQIGSAHPSAVDAQAEVRGRDLMSGLPKNVILTPREVRGAIEEQVAAIVASVITALGAAPPELGQDLIYQGIHLVGGGGMLAGLDVRLSEATNLPVHLVNAPLECVVLGAGRCMESFDTLKSMFIGAR